MSASVPNLFGLIALAAGDPAGAIVHQESAVRITGESEVISFELIAWANLGQARLANGDPSGALAATARATDLHRGLGLGDLRRGLSRLIDLQAHRTVPSLARQRLGRGPKDFPYSGRKAAS